MRPRTDTQTDARDQYAYTFRVVYESTTHAKCNKVAHDHPDIKQWHKYLYTLGLQGDT